MATQDADARGPSERVVEQRIRNRLIEYFELASSFTAQTDYARAAPIACVPYEIVNQWEDQLPQGPGAILEPIVYSAQELDALVKFHVVWEATAEALPDDYLALEDVQRMPAWERLQRKAESALAAFARRGKLSEDREEG